MLDLDHQDSLKGIVQKSAWVLLVWLLWLTWISTLPIPSYVSISCVPLIIMFAAVSWSMTVSAAMFLVIGWIYAQFSFSPPGFIWLSMFVVLCLAKLASFRIILRTPMQFMLAVLMASLVFEIFQLGIISDALDVSFWTWRNLGAIVLSSGLQGLIGAVLFNPIRRVIV